MDETSQRYRGAKEGESMTNQQIAERQYQADVLFETLVKQTKGKVCRVSGKPPVLVMHRDAWVATCSEHRPNPCLWKRDEHTKERYGQMVNTAMVRTPERMPMSVNEIRQFISPLATEAEAYIFLRFCQAQGLNPFINDAYLIKYDAKSKASIVIGIQALLKRAASNPQYTGYQAGVVVLRNGEPVELQGSLVYKDSDVLVGGWAEISRKDWPKPTKVTVSLKEYNKRQAQWNERPATMIEKVALAQGLRRVFPQEVGVLFERQELETEIAEAEDIKVLSIEQPKARDDAPATAATSTPSPVAATPPTDAEWQQLNAWAKARWGMDVAGIEMILGKSEQEWTGMAKDAQDLLLAAKQPKP